MKLYSFINLGNTCYLNSILQCFINVPEFQQLNLNFNLLKEIHVDLSEDGKFINNIYNPLDIVNYFQKKFKRFQQHDAHEFLLEFLDVLNIKEFYGKIKMNITCQSCKNVSSTFEDFTTINLQVDKKNIVHTFISYLEQENIHEYHCEKCNLYTQAVKTLYLYTIPLFLILVLKRYNMIIKCDIVEKLMIRETQSGKINEYLLYAIVYHHGTSEDGHYNCNIKINNRWYFIDDDKIEINYNKSINFNSYNSYNSYVLFYKKNE